MREQRQLNAPNAALSMCGSSTAAKICQVLTQIILKPIQLFYICFQVPFIGHTEVTKGNFKNRRLMIRDEMRITMAIIFKVNL
jgi:hypothetical protein